MIERVLKADEFTDWSFVGTEGTAAFSFRKHTVKFSPGGNVALRGGCEEPGLAQAGTRHAHQTSCDGGPSIPEIRQALADPVLSGQPFQ